MSIIDDLIYDRTNQDLETAKNYINSNQPLPNDNLRYAWDCRALNRTEQAMQYVDQIFKELGYFRNMTFKTDWTIEEITPEQANRYIENLKTLRNFLTMPSTTPPAPNTINGMSINRANEIEKIIYDIDVVLNGLMNNLIYCGVCNSGQNRIWQQRFRRKMEVIPPEPPTPPEPPIPEGCTLLSYIQSTGSQYINTGIIGEMGVRAEAKFEFTSIGNNVGVVGSRQAGGDYRFFLIHVFMGRWYLSIGADYPCNNVFPAADTLYEAVSDTYGGTNTFVLNDETLITHTASLNTSYNLYAFADNIYGSAGNFANIKLYELRIYKDDILVREFLPIKDQNDVACLYDKVSEEIFYNSGSGNFIAGEVVEE